VRTPSQAAGRLARSASPQRAAFPAERPPAFELASLRR
jgi:hypothetical protein